MHSFGSATLDDLGTVYMGEGKYAEAEPIYKRAEALAKQNFSRDPLAATIYTDSARLDEAEGHYDQAEPLDLLALGLGQ